MIPQKVVNVYSSVKPFYYFMKFLGLLQPTLKENESFEIKFHDKIWSTISMGIILSTMYAFYRDQLALWETNFFLMNAYTLCSLLGYLIQIFIILYQWKFSRKIVKILGKLNEFDVQVSKALKYFTKCKIENF